MQPAFDQRGLPDVQRCAAVGEAVERRDLERRGVDVAGSPPMAERQIEIARGVRLLSILLGANGVLMTGMGLLPPLSIMIVSLFLSMAAKGLGSGALFQVIPQRFRNEVGIVTGFVGAVGELGGFFLPLLLGLVKDLTGSYRTGLWLLALGVLVAVVTLQALQARWQASWLQPTIRVRG